MAHSYILLKQIPLTNSRAHVRLVIAGLKLTVPLALSIKSLMNVPELSLRSCGKMGGHRDVALQL